MIIALLSGLQTQSGVCESRHRRRHSVFDGTSRSSLIFLIDFSLAFCFVLPGERMSQSVPADEGERLSNKKTNGRGWKRHRRKRRAGGREGEAVEPIAEALADPWPWSWPGRLPLEVRGCVKVPRWRFTPLLGDDDLMQPPRPVWHDQRCASSACGSRGPRVHLQPTEGPAKSTSQAERMSWRKAVFSLSPCSSGSHNDTKNLCFHRYIWTLLKSTWADEAFLNLLAPTRSSCCCPHQEQLKLNSDCGNKAFSLLKSLFCVLFEQFLSQKHSAPSGHCSYDCRCSSSLYFLRYLAFSATFFLIGNEY